MSLTSDEVRQHEQELIEQGWTLVHGLEADDDAEIALKEFGVLLAQYNGLLRYEVSASEKYLERAYSKSINGIPWHVDAPSWDPSPARMAMHCRTQATCGAGHTEIADFRHFISLLDEKDRTPLYERDVPWIDRNTGQSITRPVVEVLPDGREIIRYRQSVMEGNADKRLVTDEEGQAPLGEYGKRIARLATEYFAEYTIATLIPENALLIFDNQRMVHRRGAYRDPKRRLVRYWMSDLPAQES
jgi:hypothetical protein